MKNAFKNNAVHGRKRNYSKQIEAEKVYIWRKTQMPVLIFASKRKLRNTLSLVLTYFTYFRFKFVSLLSLLNRKKCLANLANGFEEPFLSEAGACLKFVVPCMQRLWVCICIFFVLSSMFCLGHLFLSLVSDGLSPSA